MRREKMDKDEEREDECNWVDKVEVVVVTSQDKQTMPVMIHTEHTRR